MYALSVAMYFARVENSGELTYFFIPGNLTLAWFPLLFAASAFWLAERRTPIRNLLASACSVLWLLFLPNAPYVITDLQHYEDSLLIAGWYDGLMLGAFVATGVLLGLVSVQVMHGVIARAFGTATSWLAILAAMPLCGFGIYVGRVLRWNSWDAVSSPGMILSDLSNVATNPLMRQEAVAMTLGFGTFFAVAYIALYAVASLGSASATPGR